jgi:2-C-methyl-D-erythritol 4-phosphate cytidylyltransferase
MNKRNVAIVLLAGSGHRFASKMPKQYIDLDGQALFLYAAKALDASPLIEEIVLVYPSSYLEKTKSLTANFHKPLHFVEGGSSRQESCSNALDYLKSKSLDPSNYVMVVDGDRPHLLNRYIEESFNLVNKYKAVVTAILSTNSVAIVKEKGLIDGYIPREEVYLLQTPQTFVFSLLYEAMQKAKLEHKNYSDEGSLVLAKMGIAPAIVEGDSSNIKITTLEDAKIFIKENNDE